VIFFFLQNTTRQGVCYRACSSVHFAQHRPEGGMTTKQSQSAPPACPDYGKPRSSLVRRLVQAKDDPAKHRIRAWLREIDDEQLRRFGLTIEDIAILRRPSTSAGSVGDELTPPFFTTKPQGGLGLALAMVFVRRLTGTVEIRSSVGLGTAVGLRCPEHASQESAVAAHSGPE
jgi:hypothetical protein